MAINGWEHYDLETEMAGANIATLLELFKRENEAFKKQCTEYVEMLPKVTEKGGKELEDACMVQKERCLKVSLSIAEILTDTQKVRYYETDPKRRNK